MTETDNETVTINVTKHQAAIAGGIILLLAGIVLLPGLLDSPDETGTAFSSDQPDDTDTGTTTTDDGQDSQQQTAGDGSNASVGPVGSAHEHAAFIVAINGQRIDFSRRQFQLRSRHVHFENGNGTIIHKHADGVTIDYALNTLAMDLTDDCLHLGSQQSYCRNNGNLSIIANGDQVPRYYEISDGDSIAVTYSGN